MNKKVLKQRVYFQMFRMATVAVTALLLLMIAIFIQNGIGVINWTFLTDIPREGMTEGGIFPAIVGTLYITALTMLLALPVGIAAAIYLVEYTGENRFIRIINTAITNLAGVPSIIYGLFGFGLFVVFFRLGTSVISGALTLFLLVQPILISASREALLSVPRSFREGSLALGATKWQTIRRNVLPYGIPGILTGTILAIARIAGETAPIMFTAAFYYSPTLPTSPLYGTMALSTHIYYMATQHPNPLLVRPIVYGTALVLLGLVLSLNMLAIAVRTRHRRRRNW